MRRCVGWIIGVFLAGCLVPDAMAGVGAGNVELGLDTGYIFLGSGDLETGIDAGARMGLRGSLHITDHVAIEGQVAFAESRGDCGFLDCDDVDTRLRTLFVSLLIGFKPIEEDDEGSMAPYVLVGVGESDLEFEGDISMQDSSRAYQAGAGIRLNVRRAGVRGEILVIKDNTFHDRSIHWTFNLGLSVILGGIDRAP